MPASPRRAPSRALLRAVLASAALTLTHLAALRPEARAAVQAEDTIQVSNSVGLPRALGACVTTQIVRIGSHTAVPSGSGLQRSPQRVSQRPPQPPRPAGLAVGYANAGSQVSVVRLPEITRSRVDDRVVMCLVSSPQACPGGGETGRAYQVTNERTRETWTLPDPDRPCAGR